MNRGFLALITAIIMSVVLLLLATTLGFTSFSGRFNILDSEMKERSSALADACVDDAILRLANDINYQGDATTTVSATDQCYTGSIPPTVPTKTFQTRGVYSNSYTNLRVTIDTDNFSVVFYEEIPTF